MANIFKYYTKILFMIYVFLTHENVIENPKLIISDFQEPTLFIGNSENYSIITLGRIYTFEKLKGNITSMTDVNSYSSPYYLCIDESNNYFLYANKDYYKININSNFQIININKAPTNSEINSCDEISGCITQPECHKDGINIEKNEIIFYGKKEGYLYFYYIKQNWGNDANSLGSFKEKLACKFIYDLNYLCAYIKNNDKIEISLIILKKSSQTQDIVGRYSYDLNNLQFDNLFLFDTKINQNKLLCSKKKDGTEIICYKIEFNNNQFSSSDLNIKFDVVSKENVCDLTWFYYEYLLCCGGENIISCYRLNNKYILFK